MRIEQRIAVSFAYPVVFTKDIFGTGNPILNEILERGGDSRTARIVCFLDSNVAAHHPNLAAQIRRYFDPLERVRLATDPIIFRGGETAKNGLPAVESLCASLLDSRMDRHSYVLAIGGGALLDVVGLATSLVHRGLRLIRVPTTVLSQNDAGVGVKNGINFQGSKNALGTFSPPFAVLNDFDFLRTLPDREWRGGIAEAFKVAIIRDREFFDWLCAHAVKLRARDAATMEHLVRRCAELHLEHIRTSGDPFEFGRARPLDFGHWAAHKIETLTDFGISHGEAVAAGIALDSCYAQLRGWLAEEEFRRVWRGLTESGLRLWFKELEHAGLHEGLREFREHLGGELCVTFPHGLGACQHIHEVDFELLNEAVRTLKRLDETSPD